jgi:hypothetical protein
MTVLLASFFSLTVGIIASSGLDLDMLWSTVVSTVAYFGAHHLIKKLI